MKKKKIFFFLICVFFIICVIYFINKKNYHYETLDNNFTTEETFSSNKLEDVSYSSEDKKGNKYIINASLAEIDFDNRNILFLTNVKAIIEIKNSDNIYIKSDYGKYDSENFDTIFSKNVIVTYINDEIKSDYLDFSLDRNSMIISKDVIYTSLGNVLEADVVEMNIKTKDTKIFMLEDNKKVSVKSKN